MTFANLRKQPSFGGLL